MSSLRRSHVFLLPTLPVVLAILVLLGFTALRQASTLGGVEFWLMAWLLGFIVGLPLLVVGLALAGSIQRHAQHPAIIPNTGVKIPGAGR
jgi:hypothetical protein